MSSRQTSRGGLPGAQLALSPAAMVWLLGGTQIVGYGTLYYSFAILAEAAAASIGRPVSWLFGCLSLGLLAGGLVAPSVGRAIDRLGAGLVMTVGSLLAAAALGMAALAPNAIWLAAAIIAAQIVSTLVLYEAAFAALVQSAGPEAPSRILHLTLIGGFASTLFWPLTAWLEAALDWRQVYVCFALAQLVLAFPAHGLLALHQGRGRRRPPTVRQPSAEVGEGQATAPGQRLLWVATIGFALSGFALSAILAQMVPLLTALGLGASALLVGALFGPAQVVIRFTNMLVGMRRHPIVATVVAVGMVPLAIALLTLSAPTVWGAVLFAVLLGFGSGLKSIVQGTLPLALFGADAYGSRLGFMVSVRQILAAVAPFALSGLTEIVGPRAALGVLVTVGLLALACMIEVARSRT